MSHGLCTLSHVSYATQPRYCRNYALKIYDARRNRRNAPSVARFSLPITAHTISVTSNDYSPLKVPLRGRGCNLTIVDLLAHSLTAWCQAMRLNSNDILHPSGSSFLCFMRIIQQYLSTFAIRSPESIFASRS